MRIPEVRARLRQLAQIHGIPELNNLSDELFRRKPHRKSPAKSKRVTIEIMRSVQTYAQAHPTASHQEIATLHGINPGRVSEILAGYRE